MQGHSRRQTLSSHGSARTSCDSPPLSSCRHIRTAFPYPRQRQPGHPHKAETYDGCSVRLCIKPYSASGAKELYRTCNSRFAHLRILVSRQSRGCPDRQHHDYGQQEEPDDTHYAGQVLQPSGHHRHSYQVNALSLKLSTSQPGWPPPDKPNPLLRTTFASRLDEAP